MRDTFEGSLARQTLKCGTPGLEYRGPSLAAWQSDDYSTLEQTYLNGPIEIERDQGRAAPRILQTAQTVLYLAHTRASGEDFIEFCRVWHDA